MTLISNDPPALQRFSDAFIRNIDAWFAARRELRRVRSQMRDLAHLSDHLLRDAGLEEFIVPRGPVIHAFWR